MALFQSPGLSLDLSGAKPLQKPQGNIPGSGLLSSLGSIFSPNKPAGSLYGSNPQPLISPTFSQATAPKTALTPSTFALPQLPQQTSSFTPGMPNTSGTPSSTTSPYSQMSDQQMTQYLQSKTASNKNTQNQPVSQPIQPDYNALYSQLGQIQQSLNGMTPRNFGVSDTNTVDSNMMTSGSKQDLLDLRQNKENAMMSGKNPDGTPNNSIPTDSLIGNYTNQLYNSSLYSPEEKAALQQYSDATQQINTSKLAETRKIQQLEENGNITKEEADGAKEDINRRYGYDLAYATTNQANATTQLDVFGRIRANQTDALKNVLGQLQPTSVAPGSTLYNPVTGTMYQGSGASPSTILSSAQELEQAAIANGTVERNQDGSVNHNAYIQQAQQYYQTGGVGGGSYSGNSGTGMSGVPSQVQTYLDASGGQYINEDKVPTNQRDTIKQLAAQNGVPFLNGDEVDKLRAIDVTGSNLEQLQSLTSQILKSGTTGRIMDALLNPLKSKLQTDQNISSFNTYRDTAINTIQALAGGAGSGLRLNAGEIDTAVSNLPKITDNVETAQKKIALVQGFLSKWQNEILTGKPTDTSKGSGTSGVVQTKIGAIDTNW